MQGKTEQEDRGQRRADAMAGNVDQSMAGEHEGGNQRRQAKPLVCSFLHGNDVTKQEHRAGQHEHDRGPAQFRPEPKPIALRM